MKQELEMSRVDISQHLLLNEQSHSSETIGELTCILNDLALASIEVKDVVSRAGLTDARKNAGYKNIQKEEVTEIDVFANGVYKKVAISGDHIAGYASEEEDDYTTLSHSKDRKYILCLDPLDGSSNIKVNGPVGSIFSIYERIDVNKKVNKEDFMQRGRNQLCAGYFLYGPSTVLVITTGNGVNEFTLDPNDHEYKLSRSNIKIPQTGKVYSVNESYQDRWSQSERDYVCKLRADHTLRYGGTLAADFHGILLRGGVFLYLADVNNPKGKLRLNFEVKQLAFIVEQAGGWAIDGRRFILDLISLQLHERTSLIIGSKNDVISLEGLHQYYQFN